MRRLLAALLALSLATSASAKVLVVVGRQSSDPFADPGAWFGKQDQNTFVPSVLTALGVDFDVISASNSALNTENCRTGVFGYEGGRTVTYDAIIHTQQLGTASGRGYRPDSLTMIGPSQPRALKYIRVPQILMSYNGANMSDSPTCSTLTSHWDNTSLTNNGQVNYSPKDPTVGYISGISKNFVLTSQAVTWPGGYTMVLRSGVGAGWAESYSYSPRTWPDSLWQRIPSAAPNSNLDSAVVTAKRMDNIPSCNGAVYVFVSDHDNSETYRDPIPFMVALAYVDSLKGGTILGTAKRVPLKLAFQIRGAFSRGAQLGIPTSTGGITETDSTNFIASLDSIATLGVPVTVGVNIDSLGFYSNYDKRWWARVPSAKYGVAQTTGTTDTTNVSGVGGASSFQLPRDIFGRYRRRAAFGDSASHTVNGGADSSIAQLVRGAFWKLDSTFGSARVDRILMAHGDDWSPVNHTSLPRDSVIYAMSMGGAKGLTVNPVASITKGVGYDAFSENDPLLFNRSRGPFKLLVTEGACDSGSVPWDNFLSSGGYAKRFYFTEKQWRGALQAINSGMYLQVSNMYPTDAAFVQGTEGLKFMGTGRIITIHCADLQSGTRADASTLPLRPGWKTIKYMVNAARIVNSYGYRGKPIISFVYPEDIEP